MQAAEAFEQFGASLIGTPISHIWRGYGSALFIEIGDLSPWRRRDGTPGHAKGQVSLGVEWSWRIEDSSKILCGSWSDGALWEPAFDLLRNSRITRRELFGILPEIAVSTDSGARFASFSTTDGQPQWYFVDRRSGPARWFSIRDGQLHLGDGSETKRS